MVRTHANGREIGDHRVCPGEVRCGKHRRQGDHTSAGGPGGCDACRRVLEHDTPCRVVTETLRSEPVAVGGRLPLVDILARHEDRRYRESDRRQSEVREGLSTGGDDGPAADRESRQEFAGTRDGPQTVDVRELSGVKPRCLPVRLEMRSRGLHGVTRPAPMRDPQDLLRIELMALGPAAARSLDDRAGIDQNAVQIKQKRRTTDLHSP